MYMFARCSGVTPGCELRLYFGERKMGNCWGGVMHRLSSIIEMIRRLYQEGVSSSWQAYRKYTIAIALLLVNANNLTLSIITGLQGQVW